jgi:hypothetical protein
MGRPRKTISTQTEAIGSTDTESTNDLPKKIPTPNDIEWTDYVLSLLSDDEKISDNPTTDGLRRIFEVALNCTITESTSDVVQAPDINNEKRATVVHSLTFFLNDGGDEESPIKYRVVSGAADVYWGNCDKIYRNHPVAVAETRAEGRALRRGLKLRKVVAAEELAKDIEDHPDHDTVTKITNNQLNFMDVLAKRMNINVEKLLDKLAIDRQNIYNISYNDAVAIIRSLTEYQQQNNVSEDILGYESSWK